MQEKEDEQRAREELAAPQDPEGPEEGGDGERDSEGKEEGDEEEGEEESDSSDGGDSSDGDGDRPSDPNNDENNGDASMTGSMRGVCWRWSITKEYLERLFNDGQKWRRGDRVCVENVLWDYFTWEIEDKENRRWIAEILRDKRVPQDFWTPLPSDDEEEEEVVEEVGEVRAAPPLRRR